MTLLRALLLVLLPASALALNPGLGAPPAEVDRSTPSAAVGGFLEAAHAHDYSRAAHYLSLDHLPPEAQAAEGARLARRLAFLLDRFVWPDLTRLDSTDRERGDARDVRVLGEVPLGRGSRPVRLHRVTTPSASAWVFGEGTVRAVDALYEAHGSALLERLPPVLLSRPLWVLELWQWLGLLLVLGVAWGACAASERLVLRLAIRAAGLTRSGWDDQLLQAGHGPLRAALFAVLAALGTRALLLPPPAQRVMDVTARSVGIVAMAWFALRFLRLAAGFLEERVARESGADVGRIRGLRTQLAVMRRVLEAAVYVLSASVLLLQLESVRNIGMSLLASAGLAGLVLGLAAQKSISTLLAGIQLSITQPVRIGDTVIVEGEWGWVEEITLTYVVVKVWDLRRLVVPMTHFLERPFQNWSKVSPDILGTVELHADFRTDVEGLRRELRRLLEQEAGELWDGRVQGIQVTACSERTMTVRVLVSSADAGRNWDLRCLVREKLLAYLQAQPHGLPILRAEASTVLTGGAEAVPLFGPAPPPRDTAPRDNVLTPARPLRER